MNVIIAIDSFKGCLTSALANQSAADGILSVSPDAKVVQMPVSDGGEGCSQPIMPPLVAS